MRTYFREWRIFKGLGQQELAEILGVNRQRVWRIETGAADYDGTYLQAFSKACGCQTIADPLCRPPDLMLEDELSESMRTKRAAEIAKLVESASGDNIEK